MKKYILTYGIAYVEEINGKQELIEEVSSITTNKDKAERLVRLCNEHKLSPIQLKEKAFDLIEA